MKLFVGEPWLNPHNTLCPLCERRKDTQLHMLSCYVLQNILPHNNKTLLKYEHMNGTTRELSENIPNWEYYPQLGISNYQLGIIYLIGDWGYMSLVK